MAKDQDAGVELTLPATPAKREDPGAVAALREFHFERITQGSPSFDGIVPACFWGADDDRGSLHLVASQEKARADRCIPLAAWLESSEGSESVLARHSGELVERLDDVLGQRPEVGAFEALRQAFAELSDSGNVADDERPALEEELEARLATLPNDACIVRADSRLPLRLLARAIRSNRQDARGRWRQEVSPILQALDARLRLDERRRDGESPERLRHELGAFADRFLDAGALSQRVRPQQGGELTDERRRRMQETAEDLRRGLQGADEEEAPTLVCEPGLAHRLGLGEGDLEYRLETDDDPCVGVARSFDAAANEVARTLAATRVARLELDDRYEPERHDPGIARFDWQAFRRDELPLLPPFVALVSADHAATDGMAALSRLLRSGRPVQVVVILDPAATPGCSEATTHSELRFEPAYFGISHRGVVVHQGSEAAPDVLCNGFARALAAAGAALHVFQAPAPSDAPNLARPALLSRAHPGLLFDPGGTERLDRLDLNGNPEATEDWVPISLEARAANGIEPLELAMTFADFALLSGRFAADFHPVPEDLDSEALYPVWQWLTLRDDEALHALPFIWVADAEGRLQRLAISRQLALECRDRLESWRTLQQLAGVRDPFAEAARVEGQEEARGLVADERRQLEAEHAQALEEQRKQVAAQVVQRLMKGLISPPTSGSN